MYQWEYYCFGAAEVYVFLLEALFVQMFYLHISTSTLFMVAQYFLLFILFLFN